MIQFKPSRFSSFISGVKDGSAFQLKLRDRASAATVLAAVLKSTQDSVKRSRRDNNSPILAVFGIPRGGMVVAEVVAKELGADMLDVVISRKLRAPDNRENSIGAISPDGSVYLDEFMVSSLRVPAEYIQKERSEQIAEIARRVAAYRPKTGEQDLLDERLDLSTKGRGIVALLIDDGIASGATAIASARWISRKYDPKQLIIATPVASRQAVELLEREGYVVETVTTPSHFSSVGQFYADYDNATDEKVIKIMQRRFE